MRISLAHILVGFIILGVLLTLGRHNPLVPACLVGSALIGGALGQLLSGSTNGYIAGAVLASVWGLVVLTLTWLMVGDWFLEEDRPFAILIGMFGGIVVGGVFGAIIGLKTKTK